MIEIDGKHYKLEEVWVLLDEDNSAVNVYSDGKFAFISTGSMYDYDIELKKAFVLVEVES